jgi:hypothetical protein
MAKVRDFMMPHVQSGLASQMLPILNRLLVNDLDDEVCARVCGRGNV